MSALAPWQQRMYAQAVEAADAGRLGHGLLWCGPAQLGKRAVAERLAQRLLCLDRAGGGEACGRCRSCQLFSQRHQRDPVETRPDGSLAHPWGHSGHPDLVFIGHEVNDKARPPRLRTEIVIEQVRNLAERMGLTPQFSAVQIAIIDPADAINHNACNALLKTLEEPVAGRYLWLISSQPARLSATIRSRCQRLEFRLPPQDEAVAWLRSQGHADAVAAEALDAARGHPGLADQWLRHNGLTMRREVAGDLAAIARAQTAPMEVAQRWAGDQPEARLRHAADVALAEAARLTDPRRARSLGLWFDQANRARELLRTTVRVDLVLLELLSGWRGGEPGRR